MQLASFHGEALTCQPKGTEVTLNPCESVRILAFVLMPLPPTESCQSEDTATFRVDFEVYATTRKREPEPAMPDAYGIDERKLVVAKRKEKVPDH